MIGKTECLFVYVLLYTGAIIALFARAFARRSLLEYCRADTVGTAESAGTEGRLRRLLLSMPRDAATLRGLRTAISDAPGQVRRTYRSFRLLTWAAVILIGCLVFFAIGAHRICQG